MSSMHCFICNRINLKKIGFAFIHAIILFLFSYWIWNSPIAFGVENEFLRKLNLAKFYFETGQNRIDSSVVLINIAYDKTLIPVFDDYGINKGKIDITDRGKIAHLFSILSKDTAYKYILCDIAFDERFKSESDSLLKNSIGKLPKIVFPYNNDNQPVLPPKEKLASSAYMMTFLSSDFFKYQYIQQNNIKSISLKMWEELYGGSMKNYILLHTINKKMALNSVILPLNFTVNDAYSDNGDKMIYHLGADLLDVMSENEIADLCRDKIVLIGDFFENDMHTTVRGTLPGILIHYNAYLTLVDGHATIPVSLCILLCIVFFVFTLGIVFNYSFIDIFPKKWNLKKRIVLELLLSWTGYSFVIAILSIILYMIWGVYLEIFIISSWLTLLGGIIAVYSKKNRLNK